MNEETYEQTPSSQRTPASVPDEASASDTASEAAAASVTENPQPDAIPEPESQPQPDVQEEPSEPAESETEPETAAPIQPEPTDAPVSSQPFQRPPVQQPYTQPYRQPQNPSSQQQPYGMPQWNTGFRQPYQQTGYGQQNFHQYGQPNASQYGFGQAPQYPPYQQPNPVYGMPQPAPKKKETAPPLTPAQKKVVRLLQIAVLLLTVLFIYCIISDVVQYPGSGSTHSTSQINPTHENVVIYQQEKPESAWDAQAEPDENGAYSVQEVAALVSPSIVEITAYTDQTPCSTGSGIILSEDGYILTNAHVIMDCDSYKITIYGDESLYPAKLVGYDSKSDLAILHTDIDGLTPAILGDSDELAVGEEVVAIGNPAGLTGTVTNGIVSALGRQIRTDRTGFYMECIQTNAAISPGNSGGALVNLYGQVVGITSSKYAAMYGSTYEGLGFAITINQAKPIIEELIHQGYVSGRVRIGITFVSMESEQIAAEYAAMYNLEEAPEREGLWITEISEDCDIAKSGLKVNDLLFSVEGTAVNNYDMLCAAIEGHSPDDTLKAECRRYSEDGTYEDFTITFHLMEDTSGDY